MKDKNKMKVNKHSRVRAVGLSSTFALLALLGLAVFCPAASNETHAQDCEGDPLSCSATFKIDFVLNAADSKKFIIDFVLNSAISISMTNPTPDSATATVQPTPTGSTVSSYTDFTVTSNGASSVGVYVYGHDGQTALVGTNGNTDTIESITIESNGLNTIASNKWGYNLSVMPASYDPSGLTYNAIKSSKDTAAPTPIGSGEQNMRLTFGTKINTGIAPDTYSGTVDIQAVPNPTQVQRVNVAYDQYDQILDAESANQDDEQEGDEQNSELDLETNAEEVTVE